MRRFTAFVYGCCFWLFSWQGAANDKTRLKREDRDIALERPFSDKQRGKWVRVQSVTHLLIDGQEARSFFFMRESVARQFERVGLVRILE